MAQPEQPMSHYATPLAWTEYSSSDAAASPSVESTDWQLWLNDQDLLKAPEMADNVQQKLPALVTQTITWALKSEDKALAASAKARADFARWSSRAPVKIVSLAWKHMLCYGADNWVDMRSLTEHIVSLEGANDVGKSSLLQIVLYSIYGEGMPSRATKSQSAAVVCTSRKAGERATVWVVLDVGGVLYQITRPLDVKAATEGASQNDCKVERVGDGEAQLLAKGKAKVDEWVKENAGDIGSFLTSAMLTQDNDLEILSMAGSDQVTHVNSLLGISCVTDSLTSAIKAAREAHEAILRGLGSVGGEEDDARVVYQTTVAQRTSTLRWLEGRMTGYTGWLYREVICPRLERDVNAGLRQLMGGDTPVTLEVTWQEGKGDGALHWDLLREGVAGAQTTSNGGAYQRAALSLCVRLALGRLSVVGTASRHLFLDSCFDACDGVNERRVPLFLASLRSNYDSIVVVSNREGVREAADVTLCPTRAACPPVKPPAAKKAGRGRASRTSAAVVPQPQPAQTTLSQMQHGQKGVGALPSKRKGRPPTKKE